MEITDAVAICLKAPAYSSRELRVGRGVDQHGSRGPDETCRPRKNDRRPDQTHDGIKPYYPKEAAGKKGDDRQHGRERVGHDVNVGCSDVGVVMGMIISLTVPGFMMMMMARVRVIIMEEPSAAQIDQQANASNR